MTSYEKKLILANVGFAVAGVLTFAAGFVKLAVILGVVAFIFLVTLEVEVDNKRVSKTNKE